MRGLVRRALVGVADGDHASSCTPGIARGSARAMRSAMSAVAARLVPSGARTLTSNCAWSSSGRKPLATVLPSGTSEHERQQRRRARSTQRWRITQREHRHVDALDRAVEAVDQRARASSCARRARRRASRSGGSSQRADSIGVSVKLTSSETPMANAIVRPKLREEAADDAGHERDRQEHRHQRQRGREHRQADLLGRQRPRRGTACSPSRR